MPKITKNNEILKSLLELTPPAWTPHLDNHTQKLKSLTEGNTIGDSAKVEEVKPLLAHIQSISGALFAQILRMTLQSATNSNVDSVVEIMLQLAKLNYDEDEVISELKRCKQIDVVLALALLWKYHVKDANSTQNQFQGLQSVTKIIRLLLISFPVDLMVSGRAFLAKWRDFLRTEASSIEEKNNIETLASRVIGRHGKEERGHNQFIDIIIPL